MLDNVWIIPLIMAVSFVLILFFGKRLPKKGAEIGIVAIGASFVLACVTAVQWIDKVESAGGEEGGHRGLAALGQPPQDRSRASHHRQITG